MPTLWFLLVALMLVAYVVLDGFDLGAGAIHLMAGRRDQERATIIRAIGPVWDGNEVWLLAAGGTLYFAFPQLYASAFSGFYLPLMMVLWLLILRAIGIEFRIHSTSHVWRSFFDTIFSVASALLAIFYGAALGNVVRGVPLNASGYFFAALWTHWRVGPDPGILDWYTVLCGVVALVALTLHGALYIALKTEDEVNQRSRKIATVLWPVLVAVTLLSLIATLAIRPQVMANFRDYPIGFGIPLLVVVALAGILYFHLRNNEKAAFLSSCVYLAGMLGGAAFGLYPNVLPAINDPALSLTIHNTATGEYAYRVALIWWVLGMIIAVTYFVYLYRIFRGKVTAETGGYGH
ncbi:MAG TPA: cytochrome d ubiquinol oxidase subunit II [Terriglobales bacterium]|nr:cytochrome d ubiquinol oxidase subunit II [Terriglobales bacterium]